jgi:hypothetical protein
VPPLWFGILAVPLGILAFFVSLHALNGWGWVCARWAEVMFRGSRTAPGAQRAYPAAATQAVPAGAGVPAPPQAPAAPAIPPASAPPQPPQSPASQAPAAPSPAQPAQPGDIPSDDETSRP